MWEAEERSSSWPGRSRSISHGSREIEKSTAKREPLPADTPARAAQFRAKLMTALQEVTQRTRAAVAEHTDQIRSLELSAKMEDFLCQFYREASSETESQPLKEFFLKLLQMERAHPDLLHGYMAHLEETGYLPTDKTWKMLIAP